MRLILPPPFEPVEVDEARPLEEQFSGQLLREVEVMLDMLRKSMELWKRE